MNHADIHFYFELARRKPAPEETGPQTLYEESSDHEHRPDSDEAPLDP